SWKDVFLKFLPSTMYDHDFLANQLEMLPMMKATVPYWNCSKGMMRFSSKFLNHVAKHIVKQKESSDGSLYFATYCATTGLKMGSIHHLTPQLTGSWWNDTKLIPYAEFMKQEKRAENSSSST